ncbi:MAG: hypothetical protein KatS3mg058_0022 [Roseiflexus sp.]|nr:MAG: hypothetical protein KatS3mg058_0022 [Roseiflexus sp.]
MSHPIPDGYAFVPRHLCRTPYLAGMLSYRDIYVAPHIGRMRDTLRQAQGKNLAPRHCRINLSICNMSHPILECFRTTLSYRDIYVAPHIGVLSYHTFVPRHLCRTPYLTGIHKCEIPFGRLRARISRYAIVGLTCRTPYLTGMLSYRDIYVAPHIGRMRDTLRQAQGKNLALRHCRINLSICNMSRLIFWIPAPKAR